VAEGISSLLGAAGIGGAIGQAVVRLELDTKKYLGEMKAAEGQTVASTNAMGTSTSKFAGVAKTAFLVVGVAAVAGLAASVKAAIEANEAHLKLQNTWEHNAALADVSVQAFEDQAEALQLLTGTSDEAIIGAQALLGQFSLTGDEVQQLIPLIVDLSAKMGIDMAAAAKAVGKATEGNTAGLQRYGIVIDEVDGKGGEFAATLEGIGKFEGFAADRADEEPWRVLAAQFDELAEDIGNVLIPFMQDVTGILIKLGPVLSTVGHNAGLILVAFGGFAAIKWLPGFLGSLAAGFEGLGLALAGVSVGGGFLGNLGAIVAALPQIALNGPMAAAGVVELWESLHPTENFATPIIEANVALSALSESAQADLAFVAMHFEDAGRTAESFQGNVDRINASLAASGIQYTLTTGALAGLVDGQTVAGLGAGALTLAQEALAEAMDKGGKKAERFGFKSKAAFGDFKDSVIESVQVGIGQFEKLGDAFDTTPRELQKQLDLAIEIARREQRTLVEIMGSDDLGKAQKQALLALPANQREAWAEAGKEGKKQIEKDAVTLQNLNERTFREITHAAKAPAKEGGQETGAAIMTGAALGVAEHSPELLAAVRKAVREAIEAGKDEADAESPSKEMAKLGVDMMVGLADGISNAEQKAIDAAVKAIEKLIDQVGSELDKIKGKAEEFASTIRGAFSGFMDIGGAFGSDTFAGASLSTVIQAQLAGAQQLADVLEALKRQGASQALLSQVAESGAGFGQALLAGGPEQIAEANVALKTIADLAKETGKGLSEKFFGDKIDRVEKKLDRLHDDLEELNDLTRRGHSHDITVDGESLATTDERGMTKILERRGSLFNGAVRT